MASTLNLAIGTGAATGIDVDVVATGSMHITVTGGGTVPAGATIFVQVKDAAGGYVDVYQLDGRRPYQQLGPGTWRSRRPADSVACGADSG